MNKTHVDAPYEHTKIRCWSPQIHKLSNNIFQENQYFIAHGLQMVLKFSGSIDKKWQFLWSMQIQPKYQKLENKLT